MSRDNAPTAGEDRFESSTHRAFRFAHPASTENPTIPPPTHHLRHLRHLRTPLPLPLRNLRNLRNLRLNFPIPLWFDLPMFRGASFLRLLLSTLPAALATAAEPVANPDQLPRIPPTPSHLALQSFHIRPGFTAQLVAAEPLVADPVALAFDEAGAAWVVEMRDYSERRDESLGSIRKLTDDDLDGRIDSASLFATGLPWPTAIACWDGGVFVGATPDIWYLKDTDGDGRADVQERIFTGFGSDGTALDPAKLNVQAMLNSFHWGLDQRIHGVTSLAAGRVQRIDSPFTRAWLERYGIQDSPPAAISLRGRDFAFDPRTLRLEATPGGGQHGMTFDPTGRRFVCSNSDHLQQIVYDDSNLTNDPLDPLPATRVSIAADGPAAPVFRRSPDEPWRVLRTRWRVAGLVEGPIEGGGRPSGYFTGATGTTVHRGDAYPPDVAGDVFIADCGSNLIHRKKLRPGPDGLQWIGERDPSESDSEFLASTDNWFRPVQFVNAPDGCLWVLDMYRETIEHPWSLPDGLKRHLDLNSGNDRGRLWRLAPSNFNPVPATQRIRNLASAPVARWVELLSHPNGWHRETAARLLHQKQDPAATPLLRKTLTQSNHPLARLHALHILAAKSQLDPALLKSAFADSLDVVRADAIELAQRHLPNSDLPWAKLAADPSPRVRLACARQARLIPSSVRDSIVATLLVQGPDLIRSIALPAADPRVLWPLVESQQPNLLPRIARRIGRQATPADLQLLFTRLPALSPRSLRLQTVSALADGLAADGRSLRLSDPEHRLAPIWSDALSLATNRAASRIRTLGNSTGPFIGLNPDDPDARLAALRLLRHAPEADAAPALTGRLVSESDPVFSMAIDSLQAFRSVATAHAVAAPLNNVEPSRRPRILQLLARRSEGRAAILQALEHQRLKVTELDADTLATLRRANDPELRSDLERWLGKAAPDRKSVVDRYLPALALTGNPDRGGIVLRERCTVCHVWQGTGNNLGPDLASVASAGPEKLLVAILDPNREVAPSHTAWHVVTVEDEDLTGILLRDDPAGIVLRQAGGTEISLPRDRLKQIENTGRSLMPEGLEEGLDAQQLADLLAHLAAPKP